MCLRMSISPKLIFGILRYQYVKITSEAKLFKIVKFSILSFRVANNCEKGPLVFYYLPIVPLSENNRKTVKIFDNCFLLQCIIHLITKIHVNGLQVYLGGRGVEPGVY